MMGLLCAVAENIMPPAGVAADSVPGVSAWVVGFRDGSVIADTTVQAPDAVAAAETVRAARPGAVIAGVFSAERSVHDRKPQYSDLPERRREIRRYRGPLDGTHGYILVSVDDDGQRHILPTRPISLDDARWYRDWLLRSYFEQLLWQRRNPVFREPELPQIVRLTELN
jgi:hypothetical protein